MSNPRSGKRPPQQAVRVNRFEQAMEVFNQEMAIKMDASFTKYHRLKVEPLEKRIALLEMPWYRRFNVWLQALIAKARR